MPKAKQNAKKPAVKVQDLRATKNPKGGTQIKYDYRSKIDKA